MTKENIIFIYYFKKDHLGRRYKYPKEYQNLCTENSISFLAGNSYFISDQTLFENTKAEFDIFYKKNFNIFYNIPFSASTV